MPQDKGMLAGAHGGNHGGDGPRVRNRHSEPTKCVLSPLYKRLGLRMKKCRDSSGDSIVKSSSCGRTITQDVLLIYHSGLRRYIAPGERVEVQRVLR